MEEEGNETWDPGGGNSEASSLDPVPNEYLCQHLSYTIEGVNDALETRAEDDE